MCYRKSLINILICGLFLLSCSGSTDKQAQTSASAVQQLVISGEIKSNIEKILNNYCNFYSNKQLKEIVGLYSQNPSASILSESGLKELFESVDKIKLSFENLEISNASNSDTVVVGVITKKDTTIGDKSFTDKRKEEFVFVKENNNYAIYSIITKEVY
ncbi:MAG TPA: hypothetical protein PLM75_08730 [bacterium]|nr:hypothetical protein [bacterium]HPP87928.1 hypothetical protein [bacterium]